MTDVWTPEAADAPHKAVVKVNGNQVGEAGSEETIGEVVKKFAQSSGLRAFSVLLDGQKLDTSEAKNKIDDAEELELVAKDQRG